MSKRHKKFTFVCTKCKRHLTLRHTQSAKVDLTPLRDWGVLTEQDADGHYVICPECKETANVRTA